jgi:tyrosinase
MPRRDDVMPSRRKAGIRRRRGDAGNAEAMDMRKDRRRRVAMIGLAAVAAIGIQLMGPVEATAQAAKNVLSLAKAGPIALAAGPVTVSLAPGAAGLPPGRKLVLSITGLRTNVPPEVLYEVYLGLPSGAAPARDSVHFVGTFNFFNAAIGSQTATDRSGTYGYDVTDLVRSLRARNLLGDTVSVTIVPSGKPVEAARPVIGEIALVLA